MLHIFVFRILLYPWGQHLGLKKVVKKKGSSLPHNEILEKAFKSRKSKFTHKELEALTKRTDMDLRQVERWLRKRSLRDKPSTLIKFSESGYVGLLDLWLSLIFDLIKVSDDLVVS